MAKVALDRVSKVFADGVQAIDRIDLEVLDRELLVLVGPSGCGKTTTLRMIAGLESVSQGTIRIGDRVVNHVSPKDRNLAMVFQNHALYPHMSVYKNMAFGLQLRYGGNWFSRVIQRLTDPSGADERAAKRCRIKDQVLQAAVMLGIDHLLNRLPRQLSGGERQRVALGRAIVREPAAFLLDEPLSNLDAKLRVDMRRELKRLHEQLQTTMIYVTHDQAEALTLGQRVAVMDRGRVLQIGAPMEVYDQPRNRFVASFLGNPPMNLLDGRLQRDDGTTRFVAGAMSVILGPADLNGRVFDRLKPYMENHRAIVLGIRPEDVTAELALSNEPPCSNRGKVAEIEMLGASAVAQVRIGDHAKEGPDKQTTSLWIKSESRMALRRGQMVRVACDASRAHWFDPQTGDNLTYREGD